MVFLFDIYSFKKKKTIYLYIFVKYSFFVIFFMVSIINNKISDLRIWYLLCGCVYVASSQEKVRFCCTLLKCNCKFI